MVGSIISVTKNFTVVNTVASAIGHQLSVIPQRSPIYFHWNSWTVNLLHLLLLSIILCLVVTWSCLSTWRLVLATATLFLCEKEFSRCWPFGVKMLWNCFNVQFCQRYPGRSCCEGHCSRWRDFQLLRSAVQQSSFVSVTEYCTAYFWFSHGSYCNVYIYIFLEGMCSRQWTALWTMK